MEKDDWMNIKEFADSFERVEEIKNIIFLGVDGGIRNLELSSGDEE